MANDFVGSRRMDTAELSTVELGKLVRKDFTAEVPEAKVSVRCTFNSMTCYLLEVDGVQVDDDAMFENPTAPYSQNVWTEFGKRVKEVAKKMNEIMNRYNFDKSDLRIGYFNVRFYGFVLTDNGMSLDA